MSRLVDTIGNFVAVPVSLFEAKCSGRAKWLFVCLKSFGLSSDSTAFPSYVALQKKSGLHRRNIAAALRELEAVGWVERSRRFGSSTVYTLKMPSPSTSSNGGTTDSSSTGTNDSSNGGTLNRGTLSRVKRKTENGFALEEEVLRESKLEKEIVLEWNNLPHPIGKVRMMTDKRRKLINTRAKEPGWREHWREAITKIAESPFLTGKNDRGWAATLDWFLKPETVSRLLEGQYDDKTVKPKDDPDFWRKHL